MTHQMVQRKEFPLLLTQLHCYSQYQNHRRYTLWILPTLLEIRVSQKLAKLEGVGKAHKMSAIEGGGRESE